MEAKQWWGWGNAGQRLLQGIYDPERGLLIIEQLDPLGNEPQF